MIILDADLQDPPEVIPTLIERWKNGAEVVYAQRTHREGETPFKLLTAAAFYRLIERITAINIPRNFPACSTGIQTTFCRPATGPTIGAMGLWLR